MTDKMFTRKRILIKDIYQNVDKYMGTQFTVAGWIHNIRKQPPMAFIQMTDGSSSQQLQLVCSPEHSEQFQDVFDKASKGASIEVLGKLEKSIKENQLFDFIVLQLTVLGECNNATYPIKKKGNTLEYLRQFEHMRIRTPIIESVMRIRNTLAKATHDFFQSHQFKYVHTPVLTTNDCEGAGECFTVTTQYPTDEKPKAMYRKNELFKKPAFLTVSGQLHGESYACGLGDIYTFGPTFRAENSNTTRHLCEFWMIEPELCFTDLTQLMNLSEDYVKFCINRVLEDNMIDLETLTRLDKELIERLKLIVGNKFVRIPYSEAIDILTKTTKVFEEPVSWGIDLASEHERYLAEEYFKLPTILYDYPKDIKSFYMKVNSDEKTVQAMDMLVPGIGELIGGSMREDNYQKLDTIMKDKGISGLEWYLDLRKYGSVPHGGFGLGFERLVLLSTGIKNIRDVIPYPRYPKHCKY